MLEQQGSAFLDSIHNNVKGRLNMEAVVIRRLYEMISGNFQI